MKKTKKAQTRSGPFYLHGRGFSGVAVESLAQAVNLWCDHRERPALGVSAIGDGVKVYDADRKLVAHVSYNGRVWDPVGKEIDL